MTSRWRCDPPAAAAFRVGGCSPTARSLARGTEIEQTISYRKDVALLSEYLSSSFAIFQGLKIAVLSRDFAVEATLFAPALYHRSRKSEENSDFLGLFAMSVSEKWQKSNSG